MMMNDDMREEYSDLLISLLGYIPPAVIEGMNDRQILLLLQGMSEVNPNTILVPAFTDRIAEYRPIPTEI